jgi:hypothetical protein
MWMDGPNGKEQRYKVGRREEKVKAVSERA